MPNPSSQKPRSASLVSALAGVARVTMAKQTLCARTDASPVLSRNHLPPPSTSRGSGMENKSQPVLLARLTDLELVSSPAKDRNHFVAVYIDEEEQVRSEVRKGLVSFRWNSDLNLQFQPSSKIKMILFRESILPGRRPYNIGQYTNQMTQLLEKQTKLDLTDGTGRKILARLNIKLTLTSEPAQNLMRRIDAHIARLDGDHGLTGASEHINSAAGTAQHFSDAAKSLASRIAPTLAEALELTVKIMDSVADAHPILKVSWTILSAVYKAVQSQMLQDEAIISLADTLREMLGVAEGVPDLLVVKGTSDVIEEIGRASLQVASLIDEYTRPSSIAVRTLKFQSVDMKSRIDQCEKNCRNIMERFDRRVRMGTSLKLGKLDSAVRDDRRSEKIYEWLSAPDSSKNYNDALAKHHKGTGSWLTCGTNFIEWQNKAESMLHIFGKPGSGKTVLCSSIIEHIANVCEQNESHACAYFFFDRRDAQKAFQLHDSLIRSLIQQFTDQCDHIPDALVKLCGNGHWQSSTTSLEDTLEHILDEFADAYIVIDSLDECSERRKLLKWIRKLALWKSGKLHLLVTSRPEPDIMNHLESLNSAQISMEEDSVDGDIRSYIDSEIQDSLLKRWPEDVKMHIKDRLMTGAQGMFRWVALQLEELEKCPSQYELNKQLEDLPRDLNETYDRILLNIDEHHRVGAKVFLQWAAFSARPLVLKELAEAVAFESDSETGPRHNPGRVYAIREDVLTACSSLLITSDEQVKLAHFSVKEYLLSERIRSGATSYFSVDEDASHSLISQTCLVHLLRLDRPDTIKKKIISAFPLAQYSAEQWAFHAQSGGNDSTPALQGLIMKLLQYGSPPFINWIRLWDPDNPVERTSNEIPTPLYYASLLGLEETVRQLLHHGADVNIPGGDCGYPLQAACFEGRKGVVELLLQNKADVNAQGGYFGNALQAASCGGYEEIVNLLLQWGADVNRWGGLYPTALHAASIGEYKEIMQLLLQNGADVNAQREDTMDRGDALAAAAARGSDEIVQFLLLNGAHVNGQGQFFGHALKEASSGGHKTTVLLLLQHGADVNAKDVDPEQIGSALQAASADGHEEVVQLLLEHGADVDAEGGFFATALQAASAEGHKATVKLLLQNGADVNAQRGDTTWYGDALEAAATEGNDEIVQLLLLSGAHVNGQGEFFGRALKGASEEGHETIVLSLLQNGADVNAKDSDPAQICNALQAALAAGHNEIVKLLLEHGADVNLQGGKYATVLQAALSSGNKETVKLLLQKGADVDMQQRYANALEAAAIQGDNTIFQLLLQSGAHMTVLREYFGHALLGASAAGHEAIVLSLLQNGADANAKDVTPRRFGNVLQAASVNGHKEVAKLLLEYGADVNAQGGFYTTALMAASAQGHNAIVQLLLQNGADVNFQLADTAWYGNALEVAAAQGHDVIVQLLLQSGAYVNGLGEFFGFPLLAASTRGHTAIVQLLVQNGANVNVQNAGPDKIGNALQAASAAGHEEIVKLLLEHGADVNARGGFYDTALLAASTQGHEATAQSLLQHGADVNAQRDEIGRYGNALQAAAAKGHDAIVQLLLQSGADVNAGCIGHAIQGASYGGYESIVKLLLENGANVNAPGDVYGYTLQVASFKGWEGVVRLLLENGANVNAQGGYFGNALQAASSEGYRKIAQLLLEKGADVNALGGLYGNSLLAASINGHDPIVTLLLESQANVNALGRDLGAAIETKFRDNDQKAFKPFLEILADVDVKGQYGHALQAASHKGHQEIVKILLEHGADVNAQGGDYGSALQAALNKGHDDIVKLMLEHGAMQPPVSSDSQKIDLGAQSK